MSGAGQTSRPTVSVRWFLQTMLLCLIGLLIFRAAAVEPYLVPTGSMAPALLGTHRSAPCLRCGYPIVVGHHDDESPGEACWRYREARCLNCGLSQAGLLHRPEEDGDRVLVNKATYEIRAPRRWEMVVFRRPSEGRAFVKRVAGLPGESIQLRGGDVYVDGQLVRKTLAECRRLRIPVFDQSFRPHPDGWRRRWILEPEGGGADAGADAALDLDATGDFAEHWLLYRNWQLDERQETPLEDECSYNGGRGFGRHTVHDFMLVCDLQLVAGSGWVALGLNDGTDRPEVKLLAGPRAGVTAAGPAGPVRSQTDVELRPGKIHHVEMSFMDRRLILAVDGLALFDGLDYPAAPERSPVSRPARIGAWQARVAVRNFRLYRDIHYVDAGRHGARLPVRLGRGQYFVLGDNSPDSDDSRFWRNPGVPEANLLGKPFLVHAPGRIVAPANVRNVDEMTEWGRVRWVH